MRFWEFILRFKHRRDCVGMFVTLMRGIFSKEDLMRIRNNKECWHRALVWSWENKPWGSNKANLKLLTEGFNILWENYSVVYCKEFVLSDEPIDIERRRR